MEGTDGERRKGVKEVMSEWKKRESNKRKNLGEKKEKETEKKGMKRGRDLQEQRQDGRKGDAMLFYEFERLYTISKVIAEWILKHRLLL